MTLTERKRAVTFCGGTIDRLESSWIAGSFSNPRFLISGKNDGKGL